MTSPESSAMQDNAAVWDWLDRNQPVFDALNDDSRPATEPSAHSCYDSLTDVGKHAEHAGLTAGELVEQIRQEVGPLRFFGLRLARSGKDGTALLILGVPETDDYED